MNFRLPTNVTKVRATISDLYACSVDDGEGMVLWFHNHPCGFYINNLPFNFVITNKIWNIILLIFNIYILDQIGVIYFIDNICDRLIRL